MSDIDHAAIGRVYADNLLGEPAVSRCLHAMADEIERLRGNSSVGVSATGAESGSTPDAQGFGRSKDSPCQPFDSAPTTDKERFVRFQSAVMNWISEATSIYEPRSDGGRRIMADACGQCWGAFDRIAYPTTTHDAAPTARAEDWLKEPMVHATGEPGGEPESTIRTGKQPAPPSVETDGFSSGSSSDPINRNAERESPRRECGESSLRDVPQPDNGRAAGGPEPLFISVLPVSYAKTNAERVDYAVNRDTKQPRNGAVDDESDRPQPIKDRVSDRPKPISQNELSALDRKLKLEHGMEGNPMIKARRCKAAKTDTTPQRNGALSGGPDPDSRVWETPCTPPQGSFRDSQNAKEPVAWAVMERDGFGIEGTFTDRDEAVEWCDNRQQIIPLFPETQLAITDAEREAVDFAADFLDGRRVAETLRNLLERLK